MTDTHVTENEAGKPPLISVIMPCFNAAPFLREAVDSVLAQTHPSVELIVIDDGSNDRSREMLREYGNQLTVLEQANRGPYPARNLGLAHAKGELVAFLDADDWWSPDFLEKLHAALGDRPDVTLAYCGWQNVGDGIQTSPYLPPEYENGDPVDAFIRTCPWPIHAALVKRSLVDRLGGFSERRYSSMDYDFWLRALALSRCFARVPEVLAFYRWHGPNQVSAIKWRQVLDALAAQRDFIRNNPDLVAHIAPERLHDLTEGQVLRQAYRAFWRRDLASSQKLFRHAAAARAFGLRDVRHIVTALLPFSLYRGLVQLADPGPP